MIIPGYQTESHLLPEHNWDSVSKDGSGHGCWEGRQHPLLPEGSCVLPSLHHSGNDAKHFIALHSLRIAHIPGFTQFWPNQARCRCVSERKVTEREAEDAEWGVIRWCSYIFSELKIRQVFLTRMSNIFPAHFRVTGNS